MIQSILRWSLFCVVAVAAVQSQALARRVRAYSAEIRILLPADASVFFDGNPTQSTGPERRFLTPPLELGSSYAYSLKFAWQGKEIVRQVNVTPGETTTVVVKAGDFPSTKVSPEKPGPKPSPKELPGTKVPTENPTAKAAPPARAGFVVKLCDGHWWVFREGSKEVAELDKHGPPEKHVTRINVGPRGMTLKGPDSETILSYLVAQDGFETFVENGRVWVFRSGCKELAQFQKHHELEKHVIRINAGPLGMTVKAPDVETIEAYRKACNP